MNLATGYSVNNFKQKSHTADASKLSLLFEIPGEGYFGHTHRNIQVSMVTHPYSVAQQLVMGHLDDYDNLTMIQLVEFSTARYGMLG